MALKRLHLLRHAHAASGDASAPDHARILSERGQEECVRLGGWWRREGPQIDRVLCSTAVRAAQTYEAIKATVTALPEAVYMPKLYLATPSEILNVLKNTAEGTAGVLLIGHNPGLHELGLNLDYSDGEPLQKLEQGLPTATLLSFETDTPLWRELSERGARLVRFQRE